jgi:hypothetical protein
VSSLQVVLVPVARIFLAVIARPLSVSEESSWGAVVVLVNLQLSASSAS